MFHEDIIKWHFKGEWTCGSLHLRIKRMEDKRYRLFLKGIPVCAVHDLEAAKRIANIIIQDQKLSE